MVTYFEIGGKLVELEETFQDLTGLGSTREPETIEALLDVLKVFDAVEPAVENILSSNREVTWEDFGRLTGVGLSIGMGIATFPMVGLDGPLPIMDAAWVAMTASRTYRYQATGAKIGSYVDSHIDTKPSDLWNERNLRFVSYSPSWDY